MRISDWSSDVCSSDLAKKSDGRFPRERFEQEREDDEHLEREREQHDADERRQADDEIPAELRGEVEHEAEDGDRRELDDEADQLHHHLENSFRSEERRVGKEWVSPCSSRGSPCH